MKVEEKPNLRVMRLVRYLLFALFLISVSAVSFAQIGISVSFGPPPIPVYEQPICPGDGYLWTPGYWAWDGNEYYWVPGTWVIAPEIGFFWTPGYWGWDGFAFVFHEGYWGPHVGYYGGINYGFGYFGHGYEGGRWDRGHFFYNRAVNNVNTTFVHNVYETRITNINTNRVSFNGGNGGINDRPTSEEESFSRERHIPPVTAQTQHVQAARANRDLHAPVNQGRPAVAATPRPGAFNAPGSAVHPNELPPLARPAAPNTGNPALDQRYQQQQQKLYATQNQERQKLQQQHEIEHQNLAKQTFNPARTQQLEQRHQQQTQQMQQRHVQQQQRLQQRQQPSRQPHR